MNQEGAPQGNQNARRRGWTSKLNPAPIADILAAADEAANLGDVATLRKAHRALLWRGEHKEASRVAQIIEVTHYAKRETVNDALYAPESIAASFRGYPVPSLRQRIATGRRNAEEWPPR